MHFTMAEFENCMKMEQTFEKKVSEMSKFLPKAAMEWKKASRMNSDITRYYDDDYFLACSESIVDYGVNGNRCCAFFAYRFMIELETINHRLGGPCSYVVDYSSGKLLDLQFYYLGNKLPEIEYWYKLAQFEILGVTCNNSFKDVGSGNDEHYRTEFVFRNMVIWYYEKSNRFAYRLANKKVDRSTFYKVLEQRVSRIIVLD